MNTQQEMSGFWDKRFNGNLEHNRFAIISAVLLIVGCLGGLTVGYGAIHSTFQLIAIVVPTMITLSLLLAVASLKQILTMALITTMINLLILIYNFIV
ncbi:MAG: hypothetical protein JJT77_03230 [Crocinitomicaceae bacterium]|nr:hypothetical protein [Crocinitomicaceae bacterium]